MALAFKRAVSEAEVAVEAANTSIKEWYKPRVHPALVFDYESIKAVPGTSDQNPNVPNEPRSIALCNWVKDQAANFHSIFGDVQYKNETYALPILIKHLDKVIVHMDDKSPAGKYNSYSIEWRGKELHITVHIDFTNNPQRLNLADETNGNVNAAVWAHLEQVGNISYEIKRQYSVNDPASQFNVHKQYLHDKLKKEFLMVVDWDAIEKLPGKSIDDPYKPAVPNCALAVRFLEDMRGYYTVYYAVETLVNDDMGMSAFLDAFDKIIINVIGGSSENRSGPHNITKEGKTLKFTFKINFENVSGVSTDYSELAKQIEALL